MTRTRTPEIEINHNSRVDTVKLDWLDWATKAVLEANADAHTRAARGVCCVPLLPSYGIHLFCTDGDGRRFVRLFRQVWAKLPEPARLCLLGQWRTKQQCLASLIGEIAQPTCGFLLSLAWMDLYCDCQVSDVIAYELACALVGHADQQQTLDEIDWILRSWGYRSVREGDCCRKEHAGD